MASGHLVQSRQCRNKSGWIDVSLPSAPGKVRPSQTSVFVHRMDHPVTVGHLRLYRKSGFYPCLGIGEVTGIAHGE